MADLALALVLAKWPHISPSGVLFGCVLIMALGLAAAFKWTERSEKSQKK